MIWISCVLLYGILKGVREILKKKAMSRSTVMEVLFAYTLLSFLIVAATSVTEIAVGDVTTAEYLFGLRAGQYAGIAVKSFVIFVAWICGFRALKKLPVSVYGILDMARVIFAAGLGIIFLGERPTLLQGLGIGLVCLGLFLLRFVKEEPQENAPAENAPSQDADAPTKNVPAQAADAPVSAAAGTPRSGAVSMRVLVLLAMISCFLNAVSGTMDKALMRDGTLSSGQLQLWYMFFLVAWYAVYIIARRIRMNWRGIVRNPWIWWLSVLFVIADRALFIANHDPASKVVVMTVLKQSCSVVTILGGWLVFREKKIGHKLLCAAVVIAGILISVL